MTNELLEKLSSRCSEFLVHAVDVEGKSGGIEKPLAQFLGDWGKIPITYAGGVHSFKDLEEISQLGRNRLNVTIGSALDLFGGPMSYEQVLTYICSYTFLLFCVTFADTGQMQKNRAIIL